MRKTSTSLIAQIFFRSLKLIVRSTIKHLHWVLTSTAVSIALPTLNGSLEASVVLLHCPSFWLSLNHVPTNNSWSSCIFPLVSRWFSRPTLQHYNTSRSSSGPGRALKYSHIVSTTLKVGWVQQQFDALRVHVGVVIFTTMKVEKFNPTPCSVPQWTDVLEKNRFYLVLLAQLSLLTCPTLTPHRQCDRCIWCRDFLPRSMRRGEKWLFSCTLANAMGSFPMLV